MPKPSIWSDVPRQGAASFRIGTGPFWQGLDMRMPDWAHPLAVWAADFVNDRHARVDESGSAETALSVLRSSSHLFTDASGVLRGFAADTLARNDGVGAYIGGQVTNKASNYNANPTDLTGVTKLGDAAATLAVVDDSAALAAAGLSGICMSGKVFKLDNTAGTGAAWVFCSAATGNTSAHSMSSYLRGSGGYFLKLSGEATASNFTATAGYVRRKRVNFIPGDSGKVMTIGVNAGGVVYFVLNQMEEGKDISPPIVTSGASATRYASIATDASFGWFGAAGLDTDGLSVLAEVNLPYIGAGAGASSQPFLGLFDNVSIGSNGFTLFASESSGLRVTLRKAGTGVLTLSAGTQLTAGQTGRIAFNMRPSSSELILNGALIASGDPGGLPTGLAQMQVGGAGFLGAYLNGTLRQLQICHPLSQAAAQAWTEAA